MTAPHVFADSVAGDRVVVRGEDARHAVRVLRLRPGERITVSDGAGTVVEAVVAEASRSLVADVVTRRAVARPRPRLVVVQGIPKGGKLEEIVRRLTEIGVDAFVPVHTERSVARAAGAARIERLRAVAREASKQSRRAWLPEVADPVDLASAPLDGLVLVLHEEATAGFAQALAGGAPEAATLVVGPEGGLAPEEVAGLQARGAVAVTLGPTVLRTETAALVAAAVLLSRIGRLG